jgi:hypothetical protein
VTPGRYYLAAGNAGGPQRRDAVNPNQINRTYSISYYPGSGELSDASLIEVKSAVELIADMRVSQQQTHRIKGRIVSPTTGQAPSDVNISLAYRNLTGGSGSFGFGRSYDAATGTFELAEVLPGDYVLQALLQDCRPPPPPSSAADAAARQAAAAMSLRAELPIRVTTSDIDGVVLTLTTGTSVLGHVSIEGDAAASQRTAGVRVTFRPMWNGFPNASAAAPIPSPIAPDGSFHLDNFRDGEYMATIFAAAPDLYVKRAELGGHDILSGPVTFSSASPAALEIVLRTNTARLQGTVNDSQGRAAAGAQVVLVPAQRTRRDLFKTASTDQKGGFTISGIPPGEYKLFSWDAIAAFAYFDPDFLKTYEAQGQALHIEEGASMTADVRQIPVVDQ